MLDRDLFDRLIASPIIIFREGDGGDGSGDGGDDGVGGGGGSGSGDGSGGSGEKTYTEAEMKAQLDKWSATHRRKTEKENKALKDQLEELKQSKGLSEEEREELQNRIDDLERTYTSKEELAKREQAKLKKEAKEKEERLTNEAKTWRTRYEDTMIERSILDAASENEAVIPSQIVDTLKQRHGVKLTELTEDGKPTGKFKPEVIFNDTNEKGEPITITLSPADAVKRMKEIPAKYGNLFKAKGTGGVGGTNAKPGSTSSTAPKDPQEYRKWREAQKEAGLIPRRR